MGEHRRRNVWLFTPPPPPTDAAACSRLRPCRALPSAALPIKVKLRKPMGLVLAERKLADGGIEVFVEELVAGACPGGGGWDAWRWMAMGGVRLWQWQPQQRWMDPSGSSAGFAMPAATAGA